MSGGAQNLDPAQALALLQQRPETLLLDVRTPEEYRSHHLPGAALIPIDSLMTRVGELGSRNQPFLVHCEHGIRSRQACGFLAAMGFSRLYNLSGGLAAWPAALPAGDPEPRDWPLPPRELAEWLPAHRTTDAGTPSALDLAAGGGRVSRYLLAEGYRVCALDRDLERLEPLRVTPGLELRRLDVETAEGAAALAESGPFALIAVVNYLHRPLLPLLAARLAPGGLIFYSTFTADARAVAGPKNPDFLLRPGELLEAFAELRPLEYRERFDGRVARAALLARRE